ncbi:hypothetical protein JTE90_026831 [Oedothorax gibbosus]|uniref:Uncharacterized protein n=1 Tax=Oedothorax gibbosus TaxID=931172 RepID=A0AAV6V788_9ARAC|nr:hypothetical protein JTE90_026831 [Oedothorax gibbosus]
MSVQPSPIKTSPVQQLNSTTQPLVNGGGVLWCSILPVVVVMRNSMVLDLNFSPRTKCYTICHIIDKSSNLAPLRNEFVNKDFYPTSLPHHTPYLSSSTHFTSSAGD